MEAWNFLAGGAALGFIASVWGKTKAIVARFIGLFIQNVEVPTQPAHNAIVAYLLMHFRRSRSYERMYGANYEHMRNGKYGLVAYEQFGSRGMLFWNGWRPFFFSNAIESKAKNAKPGTNTNSSNDDEDVAKVYSTLTFLRGTVDVEKILKNACQAANELAWTVSSAQDQASRFVIHYLPKREKEEHNRGHGCNGLAWYQQGYYRLVTHTPDELGKMSLHKGGALQNLIFPQRVKDLIAEIELWRGSRDWYREKGIPWKRGWMLYGPPGTGKTALVRAFAEDLNMPIYVYNLAEISNHELIRDWGDMQVNVPCIALIEDVDNVFHGRENIARRDNMVQMMMPKKDDKDDRSRRDLYTPLTFDCLLNCLDGVERVDGVFTIITTNDISKVDPALGQPRKLPDGSVEFISTRPGRIDKAIELSYMEAADKKLLAKRILGDFPDEYFAMLEFIDRYPGLQETPAQFQERCGQIALACFWREHRSVDSERDVIWELLGPAGQPATENGELIGSN